MKLLMSLLHEIYFRKSADLLLNAYRNSTLEKIASLLWNCLPLAQTAIYLGEIRELKLKKTATIILFFRVDFTWLLRNLTPAEVMCRINYAELKELALWRKSSKFCENVNISLAHP
jgi:hypothetical protein